MKAKEFLRQVRNERDLIAPEIERLETLREKAGYGTGRREAGRISGTSQRSKVEDNVCSLVDMERKMNAQPGRLAGKPMGKLTNYSQMRYMTIDILRRMNPPIYAEVLMHYYLEGLSWAEVAKTIKRSYRHTLRIHGWALLIFERLWLDMSHENG